MYTNKFTGAFYRFLVYHYVENVHFVYLQTNYTSTIISFFRYPLLQSHDPAQIALIFTVGAGL